MLLKKGKKKKGVPFPLKHCSLPQRQSVTLKGKKKKGGEH